MDKSRIQRIVKSAIKDRQAMVVSGLSSDLNTAIDHAQSSYSYLGSVLDDSGKLIGNEFAGEIQDVFNDLSKVIDRMVKIRTKYFVK